MKFSEAIYKLNPTVVSVGGDVAYDADGKEVAYDKAAVQAYVDANAYKAKRAVAYPPIGELADALYWASTGDTSKLDAYYAACAAVKAKYPKT